MEKLIFIDTNIFLDFYRIRGAPASLKFLNKIEDNLDNIIITNQIQMEYLKNRQEVILGCLKDIKSDVKGLSVPSILQNSQPFKVYSKNSKEANKQLTKLKERINKIFINPSYNDPVFKVMNRIFKRQYDLHLDMSNEEKYKIRKLALKRFGMGYPPRKKGDNSIGDAINWEWMIHCCKEKSSDLIIVTRDNDFGKEIENKLYINDWLLKEFKERNSNRKNISITKSLSHAFEEIQNPVSDQMKKEETKHIESRKVILNPIEEARDLRAAIFRNFYK